MISEPITEYVEISRIKISPNRRKVDMDKARELANSIKDVGLMNPILLDEDYNLVAGAHRVDAHKILGIDKIKASIYPKNSDLMQILEIDENLIRNELHFIERGNVLMQRKLAYERMFPDSEIKFVEDTSIKSGLSCRTVQQDLQMSNQLHSIVKEKVISLDIPKNDVVKIAAKDHKDQKKIIKLIDKC